METPDVRLPHKLWLLPAGLFAAAVLSLGFVISLDTLSSNQVAAAAITKTLDPESLELEAKAVYVRDLATGQELFSKNADAQLPLASLAKVALILAVSEVLAPDDAVTVSKEAWVRGEGGRVHTGEEWRAGDLMDYTLIISSNVGAEALAEAADEKLVRKYPSATPGSAAVWRMNKLAQDLGLTHTYFLNASGLDIGLTQGGALGSAREVAILLDHASQYPNLFEGTQALERGIEPLNTDEKAAENTNEALPDLPGLVLGKTGFTDLAGGNLAIVFEIGPRHPVVAVVLGSSPEGRFEDMRRLVKATQVLLTSQD